MKSTYEQSSSAADDSSDAKLEPLIGLGSWLGLGSAYLLSGDDKQRTLVVTVAPQCDHALPGPADPPATAAARAAEQGAQYRLIRPQLQDPALAVSLLSTLHPGLALPVVDGAPSLRRHAAATELFALAAATATPPKLTGLTTLGELLDRYGLLAGGVAVANADQPLSSLLAAGQTLTVPAADPEPGDDSSDDPDSGGDADPAGDSETSGHSDFRRDSEPGVDTGAVEVGSGTLAEVAGQLSSTPQRLLQVNLGLRLAAEPAFVLPGIVTLPAEARTPYSVQADDTLAALARRFATTPREVVTANAERNGVLPAEIQVEVHVEAKAPDKPEPETPDTDKPEPTDTTPETPDTDKPEPADTEPETPDTDKPKPAEASTVSTVTVAGDSFQAVCDRLVKQNAGVTLDAVTDALDLLGVALVAGTVLSCPLAVLGDVLHPDDAGSDDTASDKTTADGTPLDGGTALTAAEVQAQYGCSPVEFAAANAALLDILQPGVELSLSGGATTVTAQCDTLNAVLGRLASAQVTPSIAQLMSDNASTPLFRTGARALLPPPSVTLTATSDKAVKLTAPAVRLVVTLRLQRAADSADSADSAVPPPSRDEGGWHRFNPGAFDATPFDAFVDACLTALPTIRLAADANEDLWAVSFGSDGVSSVRIEPSAGGALDPQAFALRMPYQELADFSAWIKPVTEQGGLGEPVLRQYQAVSVEPWARSFFADLDRYLGQPLSAPLPATARERLSAVRRSLAAAIAGGLTPLLRDETERPGLVSARAALTDIARSSLTAAYPVLARYRAVVVWPYGRDGLSAARLHGTVTAPGRTDLDLSESRIGLDQSDGWCAFTVASKDPTGALTMSLHPDQVLHALEIDSPGPGTSSAEPVLLRFVRPLAGGYRPEALTAELPPGDLPVPLREHPYPPGNLTSTATPTFTGSGQPTLAEAAQWTTGFSYSHEHAAQDVVRVTLPELPLTAPLTAAAPGSPAGSGPAPGNPAPGNPAFGSPALESPAEAGPALAEALAAYADAAENLTRLIGSSVQPPESAVQPPESAQPADPDAEIVRSNAVASFIELAEAVATAWAGHWVADRPQSVDVQPIANPADAQPTSCRLRAVYASDPYGRRLLDRLVVSLDGAGDRWPVITLVSGDEQVPLVPGPVTAGARDYTAAERPAASMPLTLRLDWPGLRGPLRPGAQVGVTVQRNPVLQTGKPTSPALVLTTPVRQLALARPSVRWSERLPMAGATLAEALQNAFDDLFGKQPVDYRLYIEVGYATPIENPPLPDPTPVDDPPLPDPTPVDDLPSAGGVSDLWKVLPALLVELLLEPDSAATLAASMERWWQDVQPSTAGAEWRLRLALLSTPDESPVLELDQLVFPASPSQPR